MTATKPVPPELLVRVRQVLPPGAQVLPLPWTYEAEDYHLVLLLPGVVDEATAKAIHDQGLDVIMDYDEAHETYTLCFVRDQRDLATLGLPQALPRPPVAAGTPGDTP